MKYLIDFKNDVTVDQIQQYIQNNNYTLLKIWNNFERVVLVECDSTPVKTELVENVISDESTVIKPLSVGEIIVPPPTLWCLNDSSLPQVIIKTNDMNDWWKNYSLNEPEFDKESVNIARKGSRVPVYIMDSGIKADHPEFENTEIVNLFSITSDDFSDTNGHGTAIASVISGNTCGITSCPLKIVKIFVNNRDTLQSELLSAFDAIINDVPQNTFAVVNCSWVIERNPWIEQKMLSLIDRGIFIVAAAGNNGGSIENVTPAAMPEVITIGSYNSDLKPSDFSAYTDESHISYTNSSVNGGELDGWAPGENIWSARLAGGFGYAAGTSMSAAITSAILAYKLSDITNDDGTRMLGFESAKLTGVANLDGKLLRWLCLDRSNLLDLTDPKYAESKSEIATLLDAASTDHSGNRVLPERIFSIRAGEWGTGPRLFYPHETKSVEILETFPENFAISPMGSLIGHPSIDQGPELGNSYKEHRSKIKITYIDNMVTEVTISIYILGPSLNVEELADDHPIKLSLQGSCFLLRACFFVGSARVCYDDCFYAQGCCNPVHTGKSSSCYCK